MKLLFFIFSIFVGTRLIAMEAPQASASSLNNHKMIDATKKESSVRSLKDLAISSVAESIADEFLKNTKKSKTLTGPQEAGVEKDPIEMLISAKIGLKNDSNDYLLEHIKNAVKLNLAQKLFIDKIFRSLSIKGTQIKKFNNVNFVVKKINGKFFIQTYFLGAIYPEYSCEVPDCEKITIDHAEQIVRRPQTSYLINISCFNKNEKKDCYQIDIINNKLTKFKLDCNSNNSDNNNEYIVFESLLYPPLFIKNDKDKITYYTKNESGKLQQLIEFLGKDFVFLGNHFILTDSLNEKWLYSTLSGAKRFKLDGDIKAINKSKNAYILNEKKNDTQNKYLLIFDNFELPKKINLKTLLINEDKIDKVFQIQSALIIPSASLDRVDGELGILINGSHSRKQDTFLVVHTTLGENIVFDINNLNSDEEKLTYYNLPSGDIYNVSASCLIIITPENLVPKVVFFEDIQELIKKGEIEIKEAFLPSFIQKKLNDKRQWNFFSLYGPYTPNDWKKLKGFLKYPHAIFTTPKEQFCIPLIPNNLSYDDMINVKKYLNSEKDDTLIKKLSESNYLLWKYIKEYKETRNRLSVDHLINPEIIDDQTLDEKKISINKSAKLNTMDASKIINDEAQQKTVRSKSIPIRNQASQTNKKKRELNLPELNQEPKKGPISGLWQKARQLWNRYFRKRTN